MRDKEEWLEIAKEKLVLFRTIKISVSHAEAFAKADAIHFSC